MAHAKDQSPSPDKPWNKEVSLDVCRGELADYEREAANCLRRAQVREVERTSARHDMKRPQEWLAEAQVWRKKAEIVRKEISAIEAVPGQWFGPTDVEEQMTNIVAISPGGHVVASQKSDDGRRDAAFLKRYLNKKYAVQLLPEQEAHRRYMRYVASLRNFSTKSEEAES